MSQALERFFANVKRVGTPHTNDGVRMIGWADSSSWGFLTLDGTNTAYAAGFPLPFRLSEEEPGIFDYMESMTANHWSTLDADLRINLRSAAESAADVADRKGRTFDQEIDQFLVDFRAAIDLSAFDFLGERDTLWDAESYRWLTSSEGMRPVRLRAAKLWPWTVPFLARADFMGFFDEGDPDLEKAVWSAVKALLEAEGEEVSGWILSWLMQPAQSQAACGRSEISIRQMLRRLRLLPPEWLPAAPTLEGRLPIAVSDTKALFALAPVLVDYAWMIGRPVSEVISRDGEGWTAVIRRLAGKAGYATDGELDPEEIVTRLVMGVNDMMSAFGLQIIEAATYLTAPEKIDAIHERGFIHCDAALCRVGFEDPLFALENGASTVAAGRLLAGSKSFSGLVELAADWHRNLAPIARLTAEVAGHHRWGAALIPPVYVAPSGMEFHAIATVEDLLDEAAAMDNCLATYLPACWEGDAAIISLRRDGKRVANLEIRLTDSDHFKFVQLAGPKNAVADESAVKSVAELRAAIFEGKVLIDRTVLFPSEGISSDFPLIMEEYAANLTKLLSAWEPFMPRALRGASPAEIIAASGYDVDKVLDCRCA